LDDITGLSIRACHPPWATARVLGEGIQTATREGVWAGESALLTRDRREVPVSQVLLAHREADGAVTYFSTIARDTSERKELESRLRQAQKMEALGRLAGGIAHDFNNLLTAIGGYGMLLLDELPPADRRRKGVTEIVKAGELAAGLTRQLLVFSRQQPTRTGVGDLNTGLAEIEGLL